MSTFTNHKHKDKHNTSCSASPNPTPPKKMCPGRITTAPQNNPAPSSTPLKPAFDILDADHDGRISSNDLRSFYTSFANSADENMIHSMISVADLDRNGFVEYEEFENVVFNAGKKNRGGGGGGVVVEEMFKAMDGDGDGRVGFEDLKRWFGLMRMEVSDDEIKEMIVGGGGVSCNGFKKILGFEAEEDD